uniref:POMC-a n=1 Tax=Cynoglossus semilaevis TaxID=244447 RepID=A0A075W4F8_CYNSE|nr:POMC-a [Cynoglossus semilaevis]
MGPLWLLVAVGVMGVAGGAASQCWDPSCLQADSKSSAMGCLHLCLTDLHAETPVLPGDAHLQPPTLSDSTSSSASQTKRSYSMEHFRWGKPVGRKRRPIKVYTANGGENESADVFPEEMRRRELANELLVAEEEADKEMKAAGEEDDEHLSDEVQDQKDATYKMRHFRWGGLPSNKRYGGFMKSWDEHGHQRPLLTLLKNIINKEGQQQKRSG